MDYTLKGNQLEKLAETVQPLDSQVERSSDFISVNKNQDRNLNILGKLSSGARGRERRAKQKASTGTTDPLIYREGSNCSYKEKPNSQGTRDTLVTHNIDGKEVVVEFRDVRKKDQGNSLFPLPSPIPPSQTPQKNRKVVNWSNAENLSNLPSFQDSDSNLQPIKESGEISETKESGGSKSSSSYFSTNTLEDLTSKLKCHSKSFILPNKLEGEMHDNEHQSSSGSSSSHESASKQWEEKAARDRAAGMPEGPLKYESYKRIFRTELDSCKERCSISFKNMKILKSSSSSKSEKCYATPKDALDDGCSPEDIIEAFLKELDSAELVNELKDLGKFDASLRCV